MPRVVRCIDVAMVLAFVAIGRAHHQDGESLRGLAHTAWPFLVGLVVGWLVASRVGSTTRVAIVGVVVAAVTTVIGMALRLVSGQGSAVAFVCVALCFLGVTMVCSRLLVQAGHSRYRRRSIRG